jgi:hypothetical protein
MKDQKGLYFSFTVIRSILVLLFTVMIFNASGQQGMNQWYATKLLRIYHPNMRNWEVKDFDAARFVEDCAAATAAAVVTSKLPEFSWD